MEKSVYIIKPEGMLYQSQIREMIESTGLQISESRVVRLPMTAVAVFYPDLFVGKGGLWEKTCEHLIGKPCEIGVVCGERAVQKLFTVCGTKTNPSECDLQTIRRTFGCKTPSITSDNQFYWRNVIHRPKNKEEAGRDLEIAKQLLSTGP